MLSLNYPYITKDGTEPYLAKLVKDFVRDYKGNRYWIYRSQYFSLRDCFSKGLYYGRKSKGYIMEVVIATEKLLLDDLKDIKDNLSKVQN